jgi:hypothetical protein
MRVLRTTFFLLVLGNLLLFAYAKGYIYRTGGNGESDRLGSQLEPEKVRVVSRGIAPLATEPPAEACRALAGLSREQAETVAGLVRGREGQLKVAQSAIVEPSSWWVFVPPHKTRQLAERKAAELKKLGLDEFSVVLESGRNQFAISLGLFKSGQGAQDRLEDLHKKGVRTARIQVRETATEKMLVEIRGPAEKVLEATTGLPADFAAVAVSECTAGK